MKTVNLISTIFFIFALEINFNIVWTFTSSEYLDVGDRYWWQIWWYSISQKRHQDQKSVTNIKLFFTYFAQERLHRCWWRMLETDCVGGKFDMSRTDLRWGSSNIFLATSQKCHHHKVTNITLSPTPPSPSSLMSHQHPNVTNIIEPC